MNNIACQYLLFAYLISATMFMLINSEKDEEIQEFKKSHPVTYIIGMLVAIALLPILFVVAGIRSLLGLSKK